MSAFDRMEQKADRMLDEANAMAELSEGAVDSRRRAGRKYRKADASASVEAELADLKNKLGL